MLILVFNVGEPTYAKPAIEVLAHYFGKWQLPFTFVRNIETVNYKKAHPSWVKLLAYRMFPREDFILNWDLDLLPINTAHNIEGVLDKSKMNLAVDSSLLAGYPGYNANFKYNGGLMGIPAHMAPWCEAIYDRHAPGTMPSYEQYYLNDALVADKIPVHRLPDAVNTLFPRNVAGNVLWREAEMKHYTFGVMEPKDKLVAIEEHRNDYFKS